jgi:hypothetical protein
MRSASADRASCPATLPLELVPLIAPATRAPAPKYSDALEGTIDAIATQIVGDQNLSHISFLERA